MIIDADAHVLETEETWQYLEKSELKYRPEIVAPSDVNSKDEYWLIDGRLHLKSRNVGRDTPKVSREMRDIETRLRHMDDLGVDVQVLFPTVFLSPLTAEPEIDLALSRSYNRWLADKCRNAKERLKWAAVLPLLTMEKALEEAKFAKQNGAAAIFLRGTEGDHLLSDPYFYPLYEEASRLDLPLCVHSASGSLPLYEFYRYEPVGFSKFKLSIVGGFHAFVVARVPEKFPRLKMAFLEVSAQWVPYAFRDLVKRFRRQGQDFKNNFMRELRLYVGVETNDDLPYIFQTVGDDNFVIGSDYGHADSATELKALENLQKDGRLNPSVVNKLLDVNPRELYGI
ncbi:MAG TPA: amidohydrolase family protein [Candidatus Acidoferrales bacterium]|nr:amidohydrolase family protein [Candidatus Acidoferrales bacterium]